MRGIGAVLLMGLLAGCGKPASEPVAPAAEPPEVLKPTPAKAYEDTAAQGLGTLPEGIGLAPGAKVPPFEVPDADGRPVTLAQLTAKGPLLLVFYRGGW